MRQLLLRARVIPSNNGSNKIQRWWSFFFLFFLSTCSPKGWQNSKWYAIYVRIIIWKWHLQTDGAELMISNGQKLNRWSWMISFSSHASSITSKAWTYACSSTQSSFPIWHKSVSQKREMSFSDLLCFIALLFLFPDWIKLYLI